MLQTSARDFFAPSVLLRIVFENLWPLLKMGWPLVALVLILVALHRVRRLRSGHRDRARMVADPSNPASEAYSGASEVSRAKDEPDEDGLTYPIICVRCGKADKVPFEPRPGKTLLCHDCYTETFRWAENPARGRDSRAE